MKMKRSDGAVASRATRNQKENMRFQRQSYDLSVPVERKF